MSTLHQCSMTLVDLSIIIPVYNLEKYLEPMLKSLKEQQYTECDLEIIFVLNNCTDRSEEIIRESGLVCNILYCEEQGCGPARNVGFEAAVGKYVWFMDGDDWLLSDTAVQDVLDKAMSEDLDILRIPFQSNLFNRQYFSMVWQYMFKKEFVEEFRFPSIQPSEDDVYMMQVLAKVDMDPYTYLWYLPAMPEALYFYNYMREGSNMYRHFNGGGNDGN